MADITFNLSQINVDDITLDFMIAKLMLEKEKRKKRLGKEGVTIT